MYNSYLISLTLRLGKVELLVPSPVITLEVLWWRHDHINVPFIILLGAIRRVQNPVTYNYLFMYRSNYIPNLD